MGLFTSKKGDIIGEHFQITEDLGKLRKGDMVKVELYDDHLELSTLLTKQPITLDYSQITDVFYGSQTELVEKSKSPIGRAVVGGLLTGGVGAVVGAVSGIGKKEKKVKKVMFIISYTSSAGEEKFLTFEDTRLSKGPALSMKLKTLCGVNDAAAPEITRL